MKQTRESYDQVEKSGGSEKKVKVQCEVEVIVRTRHQIVLVWGNERFHFVDVQAL